MSGPLGGDFFWLTLYIYLYVIVYAMINKTRQTHMTAKIKNRIQ